MSSRVRALSWSDPLYTLFTVVMGLQLLRAHHIYFQFLFGDRLGWSTGQLGLLALALYSLPLALIPLTFWLGTGGLARYAAITVGTMRLLAQVWQGDPLLDFVAVSAGIVAFAIWLPADFARRTDSTTHRPTAGRALANLFLIGLLLDVSIHAVFLTYDPIWHRSWLITAGVGVWVLAHVLTAISATQSPVETSMPQEGTLWHTLPWLVLGPFFGYQLMVGGNVARLNSLTGWSPPVAGTWLLAGLLLSILAARIVPSGRLTALLAGGLLVLTIQPLVAGPLGAAVSLTLAQLAAGLILTRGFVSLDENRTRQGIHNTAAMLVLSFLLFTAFVFGYYASYALSLSVERSQMLVSLALVLGVVGSVGGAGPWLPPMSARHRPQPSVLAVLAGTVGVSSMLLFSLWRQPSPRQPGAQAESQVLRVFNYNIHYGVDVQGALSLEAIADHIEAQQPDVIALQEVPRGWLIGASVDSYAWLSWRLGMVGAFSPSSGAQWGHAIFSSYPISQHQTIPLPTPDLLLQRSFAYHELDWGAGQPLRLINTHFHHLMLDDEIRLQQSRAILSFLADRPLTSTLLVGDLNATPQQPPITALLDWGLTDPVAEIGLETDDTYPSTGPTRRIDYILTTPDLMPLRIDIPPGLMSDHLGIVAELAPRP